MAYNTRGSSSSAYSTFSTTSMLRQTPPDFNVPANSRPTFNRTKSCQDLIVWGTGIQPTIPLPPAPHLRHKFTTLSALGAKPTTKPLPFKFSMSTLCDDGSCRRFLAERQRVVKVPTIENIITQHARIARNLDSLAVRVRKIFNEPDKYQHQQHRRGHGLQRSHSHQGPLFDSGLDDGPAWDLGELVKNADLLSRNLAVSQHVLNELLNTRNLAMTARRSDSSHLVPVERPITPIQTPTRQCRHSQSHSRQVSQESSRHQEIIQQSPHPPLQSRSNSRLSENKLVHSHSNQSTSTNKTEKSRTSNKPPQMPSPSLTTIKIIGAHIEYQRQSTISGGSPLPVSSSPGSRASFVKQEGEEEDDEEEEEQEDHHEQAAAEEEEGEEQHEPPHQDIEQFV